LIAEAATAVDLMRATMVVATERTPRDAKLGHRPIIIMSYDIRKQCIYKLISHHVVRRDFELGDRNGPGSPRRSAHSSMASSNRSWTRTFSP
jgi:hypothetical protein